MTDKDLPKCPTCGSTAKRSQRPSEHDAQNWHDERGDLLAQMCSCEICQRWYRERRKTLQDEGASMTFRPDPLAAYHAAQNVDEALARLWSATRPKETSTLLRNLRAHAYSYAMSDAELCDDLRAAIAEIEAKP